MTSEETSRVRPRSPSAAAIAVLAVASGVLLAVPWHLVAASRLFRPSMVLTLLSVSLGVNVALIVGIALWRRAAGGPSTD